MSIRSVQGCLVACAFTFFMAQPASSQSSTTRGWSLGIHTQGATLSVEDADSDAGGGGGIQIGYGINRRLTVFFAADGAIIDAENAEIFSDDWNLAHVDLGLRFHFANSLKRWIPYLEVAGGVRAVSVDDTLVENIIDDVSFNGGAFTLGGGVTYYLNETLSLDLNAKFTSGNFTSNEIGNITVGGLDIEATSTRFGLGLVWWP